MRSKHGTHGCLHCDWDCMGGFVPVEWFPSPLDSWVLSSSNLLSLKAEDPSRQLWEGRFRDSDRVNQALVFCPYHHNLIMAEILFDLLKGESRVLGTN